MNDNEALDKIAEIMSGNEWTPETVEQVAAVVQQTGRDVFEFIQAEGEE